MGLQLLKSWAAGVGERFRAAVRGDCLLCGAASTAAVCGACDAGLGLAEPAPRGSPESALDGTVAVFDYRFPLDRLVQRFKAGRDFVAGRWLAGRLADRVAGEPRPDLVVAPPTTASRLADRGLNPALHLARAVARRHGLRCEAGCLERAHDTPPQRGLDRARRRANVRGAFRCRRPLEGARVAIVDDVVTTGATAEELARVLKAAGASRVVLWTVARTPAPGDA